MKSLPQLLVAAIAVVAFSASASAQHIVTYYSAPSAYSVQRVTAVAPTVVYRPVTAAPVVPVAVAPVAPTTVVVNRPVLRPFAPTLVTTYSPVIAAPAPVAVTTMAPVPVTTTRYRPILGGSVTRTRVGYAPVTTYYGP